MAGWSFTAVNGIVNILRELDSAILFTTIAVSAMAETAIVETKIAVITITMTKIAVNGNHLPNLVIIA